MSEVELNQAVTVLTYRRISKAEVGDELAIQRQQKELAEYAVGRGWEIVGEYVDNDASASKGRPRSGYLALLEAVRNGHADVVLCTEMTRLTRHPREFEDLVDLMQDTGVKITAVRAGDIDLSTSGGRMVARMLGAAARQEVEQLVERLKNQQHQRRHQGKPHGGKRPYGHRRSDTGELLIVPEEAAIIREAAERLLAGESLLGVTEDLIEREVPTAEGGTWARATLRNMLRSPRLAGYATHKGEIVRDGNGDPVMGEWDAIIDPLTWRRLRDKLDSAKRGRPVTASLLTGWVQCGSCGSNMIGHAGAGNRGRQYECSNRKQNSKQQADCPRPVTILSTHIDGYVVGFVLASADGAGLVNARALRRQAQGPSVQAEIDDLERRLVELGTMYATQEISSTGFKQADRLVREKLAAKKAAATKAEADPLPASLVHLDEQVWKGLTFEQQRALIDLFVDRVVVLPADVKGPRKFDPARVRIVPKVPDVPE